MFTSLARVGLGITLYGIFNWVFNYPIYMMVVGYLGLVNGGLVMTLFSFIQCLIFLVIFDKMSIDWVGVTYLDDLRLKEDKKWFEKILVWAIRKEGRLAVVSFVIYSIFVDPFVVTVHYRHRQFEGVTKRDLLILTFSVFIANLYWTLRTGILVAALQAVWGHGVR